MRVFGDPASWPEADLIGFTQELDAGLVLSAYHEGVFPMPLYWGGFAGEMGWWSPTERGILPPDQLRVTRSLRKSARHFRTTVDAAFDRVLAACADRRRPDGWIDGRIKDAYTELHRAGFVHSVETWSEDGRLVGGLYGVGVGGLFAGESMFHAGPGSRDASKVALLRLVEVIGPDALLDVQWVTDHLASLGAVAIDRPDYLRELADALRREPPDWEQARQASDEGGHDAGDARGRGPARLP